MSEFAFKFYCGSMYHDIYDIIYKYFKTLNCEGLFPDLAAQILCQLSYILQGQ